MKPEISAVRPLLLVVGPTASGKSAVAETLASRLDAELISADAFQVYRGLDIGTAKPDPVSRHHHRYHCLDLFEPTARCTAGLYARAAQKAIAEVRARGRYPLLVGGSGFYIEVVVNGLGGAPPSDARWRDGLERAASRAAPDWAFRALQRLDPGRAAQIDPLDTRRLLRGLEVVLRSGRTHEMLRAAGSGADDEPLVPVQGPVLWFGIRRSREQLRRRIDTRIAAMLDEGWATEVRGLLAGGVSPEHHAMQAIGYRELAAVDRGDLPVEQAAAEISRATWRYAKRQLTWFRRYEEIEWLPAQDESAESAAGEPAARIRQRVEAARPC